MKRKAVVNTDQAFKQILSTLIWVFITPNVGSDDDDVEDDEALYRAL